MKSETEVLNLLKTIRKRITGKSTESFTWYGTESFAYHAYSKGMRDAIREIDEEIRAIETQIPEEE